MATDTMASVAAEVAALLEARKADEALQRASAAFRPEADVAEALKFFRLPDEAADVSFLVLALCARLLNQLEDPGLALGFSSCLAQRLRCAGPYESLLAVVGDMVGLGRTLTSFSTSDLASESARVRWLLAARRPI
jgi:hypothetical protein